MKNRKGISLIVLIITIIVIIIIASATVLSVGNIISEATKATFYQDMNQLKVQKEITKLQSFLDNANNGAQPDSSFLSRNLTSEELKGLKDTLKAEIIYVRNGFGEKEPFTTKQVWKNNMFDCKEMYEVEDYLNGLSTDIYYISKEVTSAKDYEFIYDRVSDTCFKIKQTKIGKYIVHSLEYAKFAIDGIGVKGVGIVEFEALQKTASDGTKYYEPDLSNFSYATQIVYYSPDFKTEHTITIKEFIEQGHPTTQTVNGQTYTFADYTSTGTKVWANIKTTANGLDAYWVWIPRYAYKLDATVEKSEKSEIIFVGLDDKPLDAEKYGTELPTGYTVHEGFKEKDGLKGIWFSKYDPVPVETIAVDKTEPASPDLTNFNTQETKIIYYTADGNSYIEKDYTASPAQTIVENGTTYYWYNYTNKIWANVKTTANGLEAWWVWIPRFAYKLEAGTANVILLDENNKPLDKEKYGETLPTGYTLHEGFNQKDELMGIWFSKYDPVSVETIPVDKTEPAPPDLTNFNTQETKIIYYTADGNSYIEKDYTANPAQTIVENGTTYYWYNYTNKIWANVKTTANGLEAWWVWIPRFAYNLETGTANVILLDENNKPLDKEKYGETLPTGYTLHEGFNQKDGLMGIWFSKYDPVKAE